jgi:hypothetical protein
VASHYPLRTVGFYAELAEREEEKGKNADERESSEDAGVVSNAVMGKMIRDKCCRRLLSMVLSQRFAAISRPPWGSMQTPSFPAG